MIYGTGLDIVEISRIKRSLDRYEGRFEARVFTNREIDYCRAQADPSKHFAARFAAKEAVLKSMGTGLSGGIAWKDIEIVNAPSGRPELNIAGRGREIFDALKLKDIHISLTHDRVYAVAQAVAERQ